MLLVLLRILLQTLASTNKEKERFEQELNHYKKKYEEQNNEIKKLSYIKEEFFKLNQEHNDLLDVNEELSDENMAVLSENATLSEIIKDKIAVIAYLKERLKVLNRMRFNRNNVRVRKSNNFCDN